MARALYSWTPERRASRHCLRFFIARAVEEKAAATAKPDDWAASTISLEWRDRARQSSIRQLARRALDYGRLRAHMTARTSYTPAGWPLDRPARDLWQSLQSERVEAVPYFDHSRGRFAAVVNHDPAGPPLGLFDRATEADEFCRAYNAPAQPMGKAA